MIANRLDAAIAALRQVAEWLRQMPKARPHSRSPEMPQQRAYVRDWDEPPAQGTLGPPS